MVHGMFYIIDKLYTMYYSFTIIAIYVAEVNSMFKISLLG